MNTLATLRVLVEMAVRDLGAHWVKSLIVGSLLAFGTFLVVTGGALLDSISSSMEQSITSSLAGHLQVYSAEAEDSLELFGGTGMGSADLGEIDEWGPVRDTIQGVDHVEHAVPMGITQAVVFGRSEIDRVLEALGEAVDEGDVERQQALLGHVRTIASTLREEVENRRLTSADPEGVASDLAAVDEVLSAEFDARLAADPGETLIFLDTRLAPLAQDGSLYYLRCIGTDLDQFSEVFDRFRIVKGEMIPEGRRGILLSERFYEVWGKMTVARNLDAFKDRIDEGKRIEGNATFENQVKANAAQYQRVLFQLEPGEVGPLMATLKGVMGPAAPDSEAPEEILESFLTVDDATFAERYEAFYEHIAPLITIYELPVGGVVTLRGFTKSGYMRALNVRVWGTYEFSGLEKSDVAGASNLVDLVTFRDLYGKMSAAQQAELEDIRIEAGIADVSREDAEAALFGEGGLFAAQERTVEEPEEAEVVEEAALEEVVETSLIDDRVYSRDEMVEGMVLNAAIVLDDPVHIPAVKAELEAVFEAEELGLQVVDWQTAAGIVGQLTLVLRGVLLVAIFVIFLVTLVIINNTMVMATMDRTTEIGTMRAIGAQRRFVIVLFLLETAILGLIAGVLGGGVAILFVSWLGHVGVPAVQDILVLLFAGPRLYPSLSIGNVVSGVVVVTAISLLSTLYPSLLAARVPPVVAMRGKE